jgi:hypothetical protein
VLLDKSFGAPRITKDGVTVAKEIELDDEFENMGAQMVREVASRTSDQAGDVPAMPTAKEYRQQAKECVELAKAAKELYAKEGRNSQKSSTK